MDDLIRRQASIEALLSHYEVGNPFVGKNTVVNECVDILRELPPAQQWIPCKKGLPNEEELRSENETVLVSVDGDVFEAYFRNGRWYLANTRLHVIKEVDAWMPMPKHYKEK